MIVDDAEIVRRLIRVALKGFEDTDILEATDSTEALKIAREHRGPIHLLVSDVVMPGRISGVEMVARLCDTRPETKVLLMSGYAPDVLTMKPEWDFVQKPFGVSEIRERILSILTENYLALSERFQGAEKAFAPDALSS
jgi:DNA-binding NtrC family response regulator